MGKDPPRASWRPWLLPFHLSSVHFFSSSHNYNGSSDIDVAKVTRRSTIRCQIITFELRKGCNTRARIAGGYTLTASKNERRAPKTDVGLEERKLDVQERNLPALLVLDSIKVVAIMMQQPHQHVRQDSNPAALW